MDSYPKVSVIIVNFNGEAFLDPCLRSALNTSYPNFEVILVDNGSTDQSLEIIDAKFRDSSILKVVKNDRNYGFAQGNNVGINYIDPSSQYVAFVNDDVEVDPHWLKELVEVMRSDRTIGAAQSKVLFIKDRKSIDSTGHFLDFLGYTYQRGEGEEDREQYDHDDLLDIFYTYGAAFVLPTKVMHQIMASGFFFDPDYFCYHEDADLCWRIRLLGYQIVYTPKSVVYHYKGGTSMRAGIPPNVVFHHTKNRMTSLLKNYCSTNLVKYVLPSYLIELSRAAITMKLNPSHSIATFKAVWWVTKNIKNIWKKRVLVQRYIRKVSDKKVTTHMFGPQLVYNYRKFKRYAVRFVGP